MPPTGESNVVGFVDPNHVAKALRNQVVLGSAAKTVGSHAVDPGLLLLAGVPDALLQITNFASDVSVLRLCSIETLDKLLRLEDEDEMSVAVTGLSHSSLFASLYSVPIQRESVVMTVWCCCGALWCGLPQLMARYYLCNLRTIYESEDIIFYCRNSPAHQAQLCVSCVRRPLSWLATEHCPPSTNHLGAHRTLLWMSSLMAPRVYMRRPRNICVADGGCIVYMLWQLLILVSV
jgi:hypothetical protein